jgi:hypothetical protein
VQRRLRRIGWLVVSLGLGVIALPLLALGVLGLSGWDQTNYSGQDPGLIWFAIAALGLGAGALTQRAFERFRAARPPRPLELSRASVSLERALPQVRCPECGKAVHTENGLAQHRRVKHGV